MLVKSGGSRGVPLIDVEGIIIRGYNPDALEDEAIERRRKFINLLNFIKNAYQINSISPVYDHFVNH